MSDMVVIVEEVPTVIETEAGSILVETPSPAGVVEVADMAPSIVVQEETSVIVTQEIVPSVEITGLGLRGQKGDQGPSGNTESVRFTAIAGQALIGDRVVVPGTNGKVFYADNDDIAQVTRPKWLALQSVVADDPVNVLVLGEYQDPAFAFVPGEPIYLGDDGLLTQIAPTNLTADFIQQVASTETADTIFFDPQTPVVLA